MTTWFQYGDEEIQYLKGKDKKLGAAIERIGIIQRQVIPDPCRPYFQHCQSADFQESR